MTTFFTKKLELNKNYNGKQTKTKLNCRFTDSNLDRYDTTFRCRELFQLTSVDGALLMVKLLKDSSKSNVKILNVELSVHLVRSIIFWKKGETTMTIIWTTTKAGAGDAEGSVTAVQQTQKLSG